MTAAIDPYVPASIGITYAAGMLTAFSPCVLPLMPVVVGGAIEKHPAAPLLMGLGMTTAFATGGWLMNTVGSLFGIDTFWLHRIAAFSLILFGLALWLEPLTRLLYRFVQPLAITADLMAERVGEDRSHFASFLFGGLLGLAWTPCSGPMLATALAIVATGQDAAFGALLLGLFGLGTATPLGAAAYASRLGFQRLQSWVLGHSEALRHGFGLVAIASGIFLATGLDKWIAARVIAALPEGWLELITRF